MVDPNDNINNNNNNKNNVVNHFFFFFKTFSRTNELPSGIGGVWITRARPLGPCRQAGRQPKMHLVNAAGGDDGGRARNLAVAVFLYKHKS